MKPSVLQQQLPDENAQKTAAATSQSSSWQYAEPLTHDACRCPHLQAWLPHVLSLECVRNSDTKTWRMSNPIHALHLASQTNPDGTTVKVSEKDFHSLYGEEQRRLRALQLGGIADSYCPITAPDSRKVYPRRIKQAETREKVMSLNVATASTSEQQTGGNDKPVGVGSLEFKPGTSNTLPGNSNDGNRTLPTNTRTAVSSVADSHNAETAKPTNESVKPTLPVAVASDPGCEVSKDSTHAASQQATTDESYTKLTDTAAAQDSSLSDIKDDKKNDEETQSEATQAENSSQEPSNVAGNKPEQILTGSVVRQEQSMAPHSSAKTGKSSSDKITSQILQTQNKVRGEASAVEQVRVTDTAKQENTATSIPGQVTAPVAGIATSGSSQDKTTNQLPETVFSAPRSTNNAGVNPVTVESSPEKTSSNAMEMVPTSAGQSKDTPTTAPPPPEYLLSLSRYQHLRHVEDRILKQRRALSSKRKPKFDQSNKKTSSTSAKKRKNSGAAKNGDVGTVKYGSSSSSRPSALAEFGLELGSNAKGFVVELDKKDQLQWEHDAMRARCKVEEWMEALRLNRRTFWEKKIGDSKRKRKADVVGSFFGGLSPGFSLEQHCDLSQSKATGGFDRTRSRGGCVSATGDELLHCLECSFIGCAPCSTYPASKEHIIQHLLQTGHTFAISCGTRAELFCFRCGDFVYHEVFDQEKERIEVSQQLPWMGWQEHAVQRSFNPMHFLTTPDHGVVWRGLVATYPITVPKDHLLSARLSMKRLRMFRGEIEGRSLSWSPKALDFAAYQLLQHDASWRLSAPVGLYNLGNTCFMSAVIQCLVHCVPLQRHFLGEVGHHYESCQVLRHANIVSAVSDGSVTGRESAAGSNNTNHSMGNGVCLACEMDILFLRYFGSTIGKDVAGAIRERKLSIPYDSPSIDSTISELKGEPLVTSDLLSAAWRSGGMDHLAGYEQRDAHEFLQAFLDIMGKHESQHRKRLRSIVDSDGHPWQSKENQKSDMKKDDDVAKYLFEGTLRSILICGECCCKRSLSEPFLNISLPLAKEVERSSSIDARAGTVIGTRLASSRLKLSVQQCLKHFTAPESLGDPVHCPSCQRKTATKKQHTFAKLPRVLCLHLKRFDAANNKKIDDFVSFPAYGLDMGQYLPHWCEVMQGSRVAVNEEDDETFTSPQILYDLFGTVNHTGNLNQGHYVSNVKVNGQWYHCNDAFVCKAGNGNGEENVLKSEGAYVLFYIRR